MVDIHTYSTDSQSVRTTLQTAATWALTHGKRVRLQEFGFQGADAIKSQKLFPLILASSELGIPFMPWELLHPASSKDFEFWTEGGFWHGLSALSHAAQRQATVFSWPELKLAQSYPKGNWLLCLVNAECASGCCSNEFSDDKKYKCTPGGSRCTGNLLADWVFCTQNRDCANGCCSKQFSDDGRYKCTPGGAPSLCGDAVLPNGQACSANGRLAVQGLQIE